MNKTLEQLLDDSPDAILAADQEGVIRYWNSGAERIFGHGADYALGKSLDIIIPENLRGRHWEGYRRVMATGETKYKTGLLSAPGIDREGRRVSLEFSMVLLKNEDGTIAGSGSIMRNVTEQRNREVALRERLKTCESELGQRDGRS
ncbi:putative protein [Geobacter sp. OR-1]|uniref:PAS domain-containing protein n=1 Tax=Geobacter sp. OR-1 TaxID=1266765 RepID=UPI0005435CB9|nr:PAS domain S-box protein [Geobacter sp. OR-1]GAM10885.1 putative protein [Geobacter sp. OR-1]